MRIVAVMLFAAAGCLAALGILWLVLAVVGTEWDYCPQGSDCTSGELMGLALVAAGGVCALVARTFARGR